MKVFPAIDILKGDVVRLYQGDFGRSTVYPGAPGDILAQWISQGAKNVHIVDLSGAGSGDRQISVMGGLCREFGGVVELQVGGGVRRSADISALLDLGATRVVVGSWVVEQPQMVHQWLCKYSPQRMTLASDVMYEDLGGSSGGSRSGGSMSDYYVRVRGWQEQSKLRLDDVVAEFADYDVPWLITDISRDGTLEGPNFCLYRELLEKYPSLKIIVSGGVRHREDVLEAKKIGAWGCIIGKALYDGRLDLNQDLGELLGDGASDGP